jgi:hypothetical protein
MPANLQAPSTPAEVKKLRKIRNALLTFLGKKKWTRNRSISELLDQLDGKLFGMRNDHEDFDEGTFSKHSG